MVGRPTSQSGLIDGRTTRFWRELEVDPRTVRRDLEFMRDQLRAPITFDPVRRADRDYLAGDVILDLGPAVGDALKEQLGIEDDDSPQLPSNPPTPDF